MDHSGGSLLDHSDCRFNLYVVEVRYDIMKDRGEKSIGILSMKNIANGLHAHHMYLDEALDEMKEVWSQSGAIILPSDSKIRWISVYEYRDPNEIYDLMPGVWEGSVPQYGIIYAADYLEKMCEMSGIPEKYLGRNICDGCIRTMSKPYLSNTGSFMGDTLGAYHRAQKCPKGQCIEDVREDVRERLINTFPYVHNRPRVHSEKERDAK